MSFFITSYLKQKRGWGLGTRLVAGRSYRTRVYIFTVNCVTSHFHIALCANSDLQSSQLRELFANINYVRWWQPSRVAVRTLSWAFTCSSSRCAPPLLSLLQLPTAAMVQKPRLQSTAFNSYCSFLSPVPNTSAARTATDCSSWFICRLLWSWSSATSPTAT